MPACDTCRKRKIRCDRESPCGACRLSAFECSTTVRQPRAARKTDLSSRREDRNAQVVIKPKTLGESNTPGRPDESGLVNVRTPTSTSIFSRTQSDSGGLRCATPENIERAEFEGETSLHAHSVVAQDLLVQTLDDHSHVRDNPKMVAALNGLRQLVEADQVGPSQSQLRLKGSNTSRQTVYELKLPSSEIVLDVIRKSKERTTFVLDSPLSFVSREQFNRLCKTVFFRTEDYPTSTAVIVHGTLENLLQEFKWSEKDSSLRQQYNDLAQLCRVNLEVSISNFDLLLPATLEGAQAIAVAASYCIQIGQASVGKKLVTHGYMMVRSLGWHRSISMKNDSELLQRQKLIIFWMFYVIDNNLSLRLGQASLIQEYDIDLPLPWVDPSAPLPSLSRINLWANAARTMGLVYQRLYSPGALKKTDVERLRAVQDLLQQAESIRPKPSDQQDISQFVDESHGILAKYFYDTSQVVYISDEVIYHALLCMIYRAAPMTADAEYDPAVECVKHARAALDCHRKCTVAFKNQPELWELYLHWTILNTPFVAFTTLFSHVLAFYNRADLEALRQFAESMSDCPVGQPAYKISRLASVFVSIATLYVESKEQDARNAYIEPPKSTSHSTQDYTNVDLYQQTAAYPMSARMPFSPFLDALGFVDDPSLNMDGAANANADLENWFNGNQHIMGLLENDLSYLDSGALSF